jgi:hypothetical protein
VFLALQNEGRNLHIEDTVAKIAVDEDENGGSSLPTSHQPPRIKRTIHVSVKYQPAQVYSSMCLLTSKRFAANLTSLRSGVVIYFEKECNIATLIVLE